MVGVFVALLFYAVMLPMWAYKAMSKVSYEMYVASTVPDTDMQITQKMQIIDVKSKYGFFFSGLNVGQEVFTEKLNVKSPGEDEEGDDDENDSKPKKSGKDDSRSLGQKCKGFFATALDPFIGGNKVILPKPTWDKSGDDESLYYTRSYYHWEFIMHL